MKKMISILLFLFSSFAFASTHQIDVSVNGMVCAFCAQGISKKLSSEGSVEKVKVSLENKLVTIQLKDEKDLSDDTIKKILEDSGYSVTKIERK